ncbi:DEAD/DEAH box helicase [Candidatus Woesearchaeota archaeon]|nr:DEAD/DEAH box helicase [Candidatus Woesearchaeota archaeon]
MLRDFEPRIYQETILSTAASKNTLVVLPTGMGKTAIAVLLAIHRLTLFPKSKVVVVAPTKPLAEQHYATFRKHLDKDESSFVLLTGETSPAERHQLWQQAALVFATPQGLENDVIGSKISLSDVSLFVFDEAHRAVGDYSYAFLAKQYAQKAQFPRILGLTASPGSEREHIQEVCRNLYIEAVEVRTSEDNDVSPYVQEINVEKILIELPPEFKAVHEALRRCLKTKADQLRQYGYAGQYLAKKDILAAQQDIHAKMAAGQRDFETLKALSVLSETIKVQHAMELLETQGIGSLVTYFGKVLGEAAAGKTKAAKNLAADTSFKEAVAKTRAVAEANIEHPKLDRVRELVDNEFAVNPKTKLIIFTQYRDTAVRVKERLDTLTGVVPAVFVGQAKKGTTGLSQKQQAEMLDQFRDGMVNALIATSVAEEGLDIPSVDLVLFYEPVPSAIRSIQRRGRTGRQDKGRVILLVAKGTRDEAFSWTAHHKERRMQREMQTMRTGFAAPTIQTSVASYIPDTGLRIYADYREKGSNVLKQLVENGVAVSLEMLHTADFVLSSRVAVEFKVQDDFVGSILDGRLLEQLKALRKAYERPVIIVEGDKDIYGLRNVHPNAIRGMLATIAASYGIPILQTKNSEETAAILVAIAKREQEETKSAFTPHAEKPAASLPEQQFYIVSSFPNIGGSAAKALLKKFRTIKNIVNASKEELQQVEGIGEKLSKGIKDAVEEEYKG